MSIGYLKELSRCENPEENKINAARMRGHICGKVSIKTLCVY